MLETPGFTKVIPLSVDNPCYDEARAETGDVAGVAGFAAAGAPGFSVAASLASVGAFLVGAVGAGRLVRRLPRRRLLLLTALAIESGLEAGACVVAYAAASVSTGWATTASPSTTACATAALPTTRLITLLIQQELRP
jgi:hypothetical protein